MLTFVSEKRRQKSKALVGTAIEISFITTSILECSGDDLNDALEEFRRIGPYVIVKIFP